MDKPLVPREELRVLLHAASEIVFVFVNVAFSSSFFLFLSLTSRKRKSSKALARSLALSLARSLAPMSAYITPSPAQGRRNNGGGGSTAFETPASGALSQHHRSSETINNGFDSDASLSSVGALARDLPPYASSPPIEAVVFAWGERDERES